MTKKSKKQFENQLQTGYMQNNQPQTMRGEAGKQNRIKTHSQSGRSMIEMLGVLAIIAILSIGGIVGYKLAMNYYQAAQIAYEMNMMRTDAKVKITQGTEELMLGDPYDNGHLHFNNYDTDFGCKYVDENDFISEETVSCRIANAYFVELPKIPNGVCQPLTRLINGMDSLIAFYVNGSEYEEGGNCQEGENDLYVIFTAETMSNLTHCEGDNDCESLENTPYCDTNRHVCVECVVHDDCPYNTEYCEDNVCKTCADDQVWGGESKGCVECLDNTDCTGDSEYCENNECVSCPDNKKWNEAKGCVECNTNEDCTDFDKPQCNTNENICEPCPENQPWNGESCGCRNNDDCAVDEFCEALGCSKPCTGQMTERDICTTFQCQKLDKYTQTNINESKYVMSKISMNRWTAERFCARHHRNMLKISDLRCCNKNLGGTVTEDYCYATELNGECSDSEMSTVIQTLKAARNLEGMGEQRKNAWYWLEDLSSDDPNCFAYGVTLENGKIEQHGKSNVVYDVADFALCK